MAKKIKSFKENDQNDAPVVVKRPNKYRYFCDACTNIAFLAPSKDYTESVCRSCGKPVGIPKVENYIKL